MIEQFLKQYGMKMTIEGQGTVADPFPGDSGRNRKPQYFNHYKCVLSRGRFRHTINFYTGMGWTKDPTASDVIESVQLDCRSGELDFEEFCDEFGYDWDSRSAERIHRACVKQRKGIERVMGDAFDRFMELDFDLIDQEDEEE